MPTRMTRAASNALVEIAIEPKSKVDQHNLGVALTQMLADDPALTAYIDDESGLTVMQGSGERNLDAAVNRLRQTYNVEANIGALGVVYREALSRMAEIDHTHKKLLGGAGEFARVIIRFEPGQPGSGFVFESKMTLKALPPAYIAAVETGLASAKDGGLLAGFPLIDFGATLTNAAYHDVDSSVTAFETAARGAWRKLREHGAPMLMEPIMRVEVVTPDRHFGDVIADLTRRRGQFLSIDRRGDARMITAIAPLATLLGYEGVLHRLSQGRGTFNMAFDHYAPVPTVDTDPDRFPPAVGMRA